MPDSLVFFGCGAFFLGAAWYLRTHEWWAAAADRQGYERKPTTLRRWNFRLSVALNRVVAPLALVALGVSALGQGIAALW